MKATIEIADALLAEARQLAVARNTTLREIVEEGLRAVLEARTHKPFRLQDRSVGGKGAAIRDWPSIRKAIYEGRGE